jgi:hypothetical protein
VKNPFIRTRLGIIAAISQADAMAEDALGYGFPKTALKKRLRSHLAMAAMSVEMTWTL